MYEIMDFKIIDLYIVMGSKLLAIVYFSSIIIFAVFKTFVYLYSCLMWLMVLGTGSDMGFTDIIHLFSDGG